MKTKKMIARNVNKTTMKTQNTLENKAKLFAQYWGLEYTGSDQYDDIMPDTWYNFPNNIHTQYLILTPLSRISDEDLSDLTKILNDNKQGGFDDISEEDALENIELSHWIACGADFLRSRGYLVPWMGLSCEDLIQYGWVKIKE